LTRTTKAPARPLSNEEVGAFARACITIANDAADENGFVAIPKLLKRFHAELVIRPLLVEGMLATQPGVQSKWTVLVDSERYSVTQSDIEAEDIRNPLPSRLRFTVAHELAHSLAFRPSDFGIRLLNSVNTNDHRSEVVRAIEGITDRLTPLLLLSETALTQFFKSPTVRTSASDLAELRQRSGISRQALIGRLRGLSEIEADKVSRYSLNNIAVCVGEWRDQQAVIRNWPVFARFQRNLMPEFLLNLRNQDRLPAPIAFADASFTPCGGACSEIESVLHAGTMEFPQAEQIAAHCSSEQTGRTVGTEFLIVIRKMPLALPGVGVP
jgi:hypothetical protein